MGVPIFLFFANLRGKIGSPVTFHLASQLTTARAWQLRLAFALVAERWPEQDPDKARLGTGHGGAPGPRWWKHFTFGACCLDVGTLAVCQLMGFPLNHMEVKLLAGERNATELLEGQ